MKEKAPNRSLAQLVISRARGKFIKHMNTLVDAVAAEQLADWYVALNARSWPDDCPLKALDEDPLWAAQLFLSAIEDKVDAHYLTLHWRAAGHAQERITAHAKITLTLIPSPQTYVRKNWKPKGRL